MPFALVAMGLLMTVLSGCRKEEKKEALPPSSPEVYMNDPVFRKAVADKRVELQGIVSERATLVARMEELIREHGEDPAVLGKIGEWNDLHAKVTALNAKYEAVRKEQLALVGERLAPKKEISK